jgi:type I restriction enzyme M protein
VVNSDALATEATLHLRNKGIQFGAFDLVLTNPPFGAKVRLEERPFLAGTGRAAVVIPDGILTNNRTGYVRDFILSHFQVIAIASLPALAFAHYGAGVKASIIFLRRLGTGEKPPLDRDVFLAEATFVGYDATGRSTPNELPSIVDDFRAFLLDASPFHVELPDTGPLVADTDFGSGDNNAEE